MYPWPCILIFSERNGEVDENILFLRKSDLHAKYDTHLLLHLNLLTQTTDTNFVAKMDFHEDWGA